MSDDGWTVTGPKPKHKPRRTAHASHTNHTQSHTKFRPHKEEESEPKEGGSQGWGWRRPTGPQGEKEPTIAMASAARPKPKKTHHHHHVIDVFHAVERLQKIRLNPAYANDHSMSKYLSSRPLGFGEHEDTKAEEGEKAVEETVETSTKSEEPAAATGETKAEETAAVDAEEEKNEEDPEAHQEGGQKGWKMVGQKGAIKAMPKSSAGGEDAMSQIKKLTKKLKDIEKLQKSQSSGAKMDKNQLQKIAMKKQYENEILELQKSQ